MQRVSFCASLLWKNSNQMMGFLNQQRLPLWFINALTMGCSADQIRLINPWQPQTPPTCFTSFSFCSFCREKSHKTTLDVREWQKRNRASDSLQLGIFWRFIFTPLSYIYVFGKSMTAAMQFTGMLDIFFRVCFLFFNAHSYVTKAVTF